MNSYSILKRLMDIIGSLVGIFVFAPVLIGGALWVKIVSPEGPVFADIRPRVGKDKKPFRFFKFRTMVPNGYEYLKQNYPDLHQKYLNNNFKLEPDEDPRFLKGAKFIRKYSIDEWPQFFNVLLGEMSIVGPRAYYFDEIEEQCRKYPEATAYMEEALTVKPGITGLWQIKGRSQIGFLDRAKLDAEYAKNRSILYDLVIVLKTPYVVITGKGAY